jgi:2-C-methyl-D-erythritol 4-phosphate cytidylyltransferase
MIQFQFFPRSHPTTSKLLEVTEVFKHYISDINSQVHQLSSNDVLLIISNDLEKIGFKVEKSKSAEDKIPVPVLYGHNNQASKSFLADAIHLEQKVVIEVEAGRAVVNNQFLKDIFQASMMVDIEYLVLAVRNTYRNSNDFQKVYQFLDTLYTSQRIQLPLKGILVIGY